MLVNCDKCSGRGLIDADTDKVINTKYPLLDIYGQPDWQRTAIYLEEKLQDFSAKTAERNNELGVVEQNYQRAVTSLIVRVCELENRVFGEKKPDLRTAKRFYGK